MDEFDRVRRAIRDDFPLRGSDGVFRPFLTRVQPVRDVRGDLVRWFGVNTEIGALRESEVRYRQVFENAAVGMIEIDASWNILKSNDVYRDITGRTEDELQGANCLSFTHADDVSTGEDALRALAAGKADRVAFEKRYIRPDGDIVWVRSSLSRVSGEDSANRFLKVVEDITEIRLAREALRQESEALEVLNRTAAQVAAELDLAQVVQLVTDAGVKLTGARFGAFFYNTVNRSWRKLDALHSFGRGPLRFRTVRPPARNARVRPDLQGRRSRPIRRHHR